MAKRATPGATPKAAAKPAGDVRGVVVEALMRLAADQPWDEIEIADVAREAGLSLGELRDLFPSKGAILAAFARRIDRIVLDGTTDDLADEPPRERLLDVFMRRLDALAPYKPALRRITSAFRADPLGMALLNGVALNSQRFMLAAAGIGTEGPMGALRLQGAVVAFARTLETWLDDDDPGLARTMAHLDRTLRRGERLLMCAEDVHRLTAPLRAIGHILCAGPSEARRRFRERARERPRYDNDGEDYAPAL